MLKVITTIGGHGGSPGIATMYWRPGTGGGSTADATDCAARVRAFWQGIIAQLATGVTAQVSGTCEAIEDTTGAITGAFSGTTPAVVTGSGGGTSVATVAAALLQARTSSVVNGRFLRGRTFLSYFSDATMAAGGGLSTGSQTAVNTAANAMLTGGSTLSFPVVWHRPGLGVGTSLPVTSYTTWAQFAALRSRRD